MSYGLKKRGKKVFVLKGGETPSLDGVKALISKLCLKNDQTNNEN